MNDYMKNSMVNQAWHQFLYSYNGENRKKMLQGLEGEFPLKLDDNGGCAIYMDDFALPDMERKFNDNEYREQVIASEYLCLGIIEKIINKTIIDVDLEFYQESIAKLLKRINSLYLSDKEKPFYSLDEFLDSIKEAREFYYNNYVNMMETGDFTGNLDSLRIGFIDLNMFMQMYKMVLNYKGHFSVIIDQQRRESVLSQMAVNSLVCSRCAGSVAMKVACQPEEWVTYFGFNKQMAESVHDYSSVELDNALYEQVRKLRMVYEIKKD